MAAGAGHGSVGAQGRSLAVVTQWERETLDRLGITTCRSMQRWPLSRRASQWQLEKKQHEAEAEARKLAQDTARMLSDLVKKSATK